MVRKAEGSTRAVPSRVEGRLFARAVGGGLSPARRSSPAAELLGQRKMALMGRAAFGAR